VKVRVSAERCLDACAIIRAIEAGPTCSRAGAPARTAASLSSRVALLVFFLLSLSLSLPWRRAAHED
jgi:hypothetical protein